MEYAEKPICYLPSLILPAGRRGRVKQKASSKRQIAFYKKQL